MVDISYSQLWTQSGSHSTTITVGLTSETLEIGYYDNSMIELKKGNQNSVYYV